MKKVLSLVLFSILALILTVGFLIFTRYQKNTEQIVPYPYTFQVKAPAIELSAPILITGDRMALYLSKFQTELASVISVNLATPIKIQTMAKEGNGLHRTIHELNSLTQWPQILVYQGASEEFKENKFELSEIPKISENFKRYGDEKIETLLMLYPWFSKIIYDPIRMVKLAETPELIEVSDEALYLKKLETELLLFEQQLIELVRLSKDRNTLLILTTTPLNLDEAPKLVCEFTTTVDIDLKIKDLKELMDATDFKAAYGKSSQMVKALSGNAEVFYLHGQISKRLGYNDEALKYLKEATAFDCDPWRATEVHNSIIRRVAQDHQVLLFDFAQLVEKEWANGPTFFDDIHPQNLYYDQGMQQLGSVIKSILKL